MENTRRAFLGAAGTVAAAALLGARLQDARKPLAPTEDNIEGPFYRKNAPFRSKLADGIKGAPLVISGRVLTPGGNPLRDAVVDVWHADGAGDYDNNSDNFFLRGRIRTDKEGLYRIETVMPGQYDLGEAKRPAHIHYKVTADAHRTLTTQLYFKDDPWIPRDPFVRKSLIIELKKDSGTFDIVLSKA
jgi:protocatechuate 3,4-dioxygenase beta subunit